MTCKHGIPSNWCSLCFPRRRKLRRARVVIIRKK